VFSGAFAYLAGFGLLLAGIGVYGVQESSARRRSRELSIRVAIGATRRDIVTLLFSEAGAYGGLGLVAGGAVARALVPKWAGLLPRLDVQDWTMYLIACGTVALSLVIATAIPALRAACTNPNVHLRAE
jgi:ABC-type antimicrobial peptide transport system permease subunit